MTKEEIFGILLEDLKTKSVYHFLGLLYPGERAPISVTRATMNDYLLLRDPLLKKSNYDIVVQIHNTIDGRNIKNWDNIKIYYYDILDAAATGILKPQIMELEVDELTRSKQKACLEIDIFVRKVLHEFYYKQPGLIDGIKRLENETFGEHIKAARQRHGFTLEDVACRLGISAVYLKDVEDGNRNAFDLEKLNVLSDVLELNEEETYKLMDLAGEQRNEVAPDIREYLVNNEAAAKAVRKAKSLGVGEDAWIEFIRDIEEERRKELIEAEIAERKEKAREEIKSMTWEQKLNELMHVYSLRYENEWYAVSDEIFSELNDVLSSTENLEEELITIRDVEIDNQFTDHLRRELHFVFDTYDTNDEGKKETEKEIKQVQKKIEKAANKFLGFDSKG